MVGADVGADGVRVTAGARVGASVGASWAGVLVAAARGVLDGPMVPMPGFTTMICPIVKIDVRPRLFN